MTSSPIIETNRLTRDFKSVHAVNELTLSIDSGELFGLVGPDGAGKTTTLRLLAGLLDITEGEATILGFDLKSKAEDIKPHVGYMAQQFSLYGELSVLENLQFFAELFDVTKQDQHERTESLLSSTRADRESAFVCRVDRVQRSPCGKSFRRDAEETRVGMHVDSPARHFIAR